MSEGQCHILSIYFREISRSHTVITTNVPVIMKVWDVNFCMRAKHIMRPFEGCFEELGTFSIAKLSPA